MQLNTSKETFYKMNLKALTTKFVIRQKNCTLDSSKSFLFDDEFVEALGEKFLSVEICPSINLMTVEKILPEHILRFPLYSYHLTTTNVSTKFVGCECLSLSGHHALFDIDCFTDHGVVVLNSIKEISMYFVTREPCATCLRVLKESCPNLRKLTFSHAKIDQILPILYAFKDVLIEILIFNLGELNFACYEPNDFLQSIDLSFLEILEIASASTLFLNFEKCSAMPKLRKLTLKGEGLNKFALKDLIQKTPNLLELHLHASVFFEDMQECFQMIENGWPNLKKLTLKINSDFNRSFMQNKVSEDYFLTSIQGNFKQLQWLDYQGFKEYDSLHCNKNHQCIDCEEFDHENDFVDSKNLRMELFQKIPSLRRSKNMTFATYCAEKYQVNIDPRELLIAKEKCSFMEFSRIF